MKRKIALFCAAALATSTLLGLASTATAAPPPPPPTNTSPPQIYGFPRVDEQLTANRGVWRNAYGGSPLTRVRYSFQWLRDGINIPDANNRVYTPVAADVGSRISVRVSAQRAFQDPRSATSAETTPVFPGFITAGDVKVIGKRQVGNELNVDEGTWQPAGVQFFYRWEVDGNFTHGCPTAEFTTGCKLLRGNAFHNFTPLPFEAGKKVKVIVTGVKTGYIDKPKVAVAGFIAPAQNN